MIGALDTPTGIETSHPEHKLEAADQLIGLARTIRAWQLRQRPEISDAQMVKRFPGLGSDKTFRKLRNGGTDGLVADNHLPRYRGVWAQIETLAGAGQAEEIYEDLQPALETNLAVSTLIPQRGKTRLVIIEGPSGSGKTESLRLIAARFAGAVVMVEAHEGWTSAACALRDIALAAKPGLKREELPVSKADLLALVIELFRERQLVLCVDEGHHASAAVLNVFKTVLNQTASHIVLAAIGTLWRKLAARSWEEARQLIHNRLHERVVLAAPASADVEIFLERRIPALNGGDWKAAIPKVREMARVSGHFAFLRDIATRANESMEEPTAADLVRYATEIKATHEAR